MSGVNFSSPVAGGTANGYVTADGFIGPDASGVAPGSGSPATFPSGMTIPAGTALPANQALPAGVVVPASVVNSVADGIVAHAGGGQAGTPLTATYNRVITVATAADSVLLPAATVGLRRVVRNDGANSMAVFPIAGGTVNLGAANASVAVAAGAQADFVCYTAGAWRGPVGLV